MPLLEVEKLEVCFSTKLGGVKAVNGVSFGIEEGETFGLIGESGSGKSVIGMSILRLLPKNTHMSGSILFQESDLLKMSDRELQDIRGKKISLIPQNPTASLNPLLKNGEQISEIFERQENGNVKPWKAAIDMMESLLIKNPELSAKSYPHQLSGGMKQRLVAGIALSLRPKLVVADEPTKGLDSVSRERTIDFFKHLNEGSERSMLLITHDLDLAYNICDRIAVLYAGEILEMGTAKEILDSPKHPYTRGLVHSLPKNGLVPLEGSSPSLLNLPEGCFFHERCSYQGFECVKVHPDLKVRGGRLARCLRL